MRVLLAGEGKTELGEWAKEAPYRESPGETGVLVALLGRIGADPFTVVEGVVWSKIRKYRAGHHASPEDHNVRALAIQANDKRCDVVVFSRDRDGSVARQNDLDQGLRRAQGEFPQVKVVGGMAVENIEGWLLVLLGSLDGEALPSKKTKQELETQFRIRTLREMTDAVAVASTDNLPPGSLSAWLETARCAFSTPGANERT